MRKDMQSILQNYDLQELFVEIFFQGAVHPTNSEKIEKVPKIKGNVTQ